MAFADSIVRVAFNAFMSLARNASSLKVWGVRWARLARKLFGETVVVLLT